VYYCARGGYQAGVGRSAKPARERPGSCPAREVAVTTGRSRFFSILVGEPC